MNEQDYKMRRKKRVKRLKRMIVTLAVIMIIAPTVLSVYAITKINGLNARLDELTDKVNKVELSMILHEEKSNRNDASIEADNEPQQDVQNPQEYDIPESVRKVYLTFDDGPSIYTSQILDTLDEYGVKATFFVTAGKVAQEHPEWYKEITDRGHTIGMHSYSHVYGTIYKSPEDFKSDLNQIRDYVTEVTGVTPTIYRFPGGSSNHVSSLDMRMLCQYIEDEGMEYYDWNVSSQDATNPPPRSSSIVNNVISGVMESGDTCIVLMHDTGDKYSTVEALPAILDALFSMEDTLVLPIDENTKPIQHLVVQDITEEE